MAGPIGADRLVRIVAALAEILRLDVADVQEAVAADAEIDERRLDARLQVDDHALVDVADVAVLARPLHVKFFQDAVFNDRDPAFFRLRNVDEDLFFHVFAFPVRQDRQAGIRLLGSRRGSPSGIDLHGGAASGGRLGARDRRSSSAASTSRGPLLPSGPARRRISSTSADSVQRQQVGAEVDGRARPGRRHGQVGAAQQAGDPLLQAGAAALAGHGPAYEALRGWALRLPGGRTSTDRNSSPGGACCASRRDNSSAAGVSVNSTSMTSSSPSMPTAKAKGNVIRGFG